MPFIRIPEKNWWQVYRFLIGKGPISRVSKEPVYFVSQRHVQLLRSKKWPFEVIDETAALKYREQWPFDVIYKAAALKYREQFKRGKSRRSKGPSYGSPGRVSPGVQRSAKPNHKGAR